MMLCPPPPIRGCASLPWEALTGSLAQVRWNKQDEDPGSYALFKQSIYMMNI